LELRRTKNTASITAFPEVKYDGTLIGGEEGLDGEIDERTGRAYEYQYGWWIIERLNPKSEA
jgi:hypothetical protein